MNEPGGPIILIVEDEVLIGAYLKGILRDAGYRVISTPNAAEAIALLESRADVHMVITDINMPGAMDGLALANAVRGRWPPIKIIIATGRTRPHADQMPSGTLFLSKPYDPPAVIEAVAALL